MAEIKITEYNQLIDKTISKVGEDGFRVRLYFTDGTYADITGSSHGGFVSICEWQGEKEEMADPNTHNGKGKK